MRLWAVSEPIDDPTAPSVKRQYKQVAEAAEANMIEKTELCHIYDPNL